ncbi:hypothetical protein IID04_08375, partial [PVC group bacterium]|nr:hypothetical protein [PVC group bacterium]
QTMAQKARAAVNYAKMMKEHPIMTLEEARESLGLDETVPAELKKMIEEILRKDEEAAASTRDAANADDDKGEDDEDEANGRPGQSNGPDKDE